MMQKALCWDLGLNSVLQYLHASGEEACAPSAAGRNFQIELLSTLNTTGPAESFS